MNGVKLNYKPQWTMQKFLEENEQYYVDSWLENNPQFAHLINEGDLDRFHDSIDWANIEETMTELYQEFLDDNF